MADKRITDLPLILSGDISTIDVLPIVNVEADVTNKITIDQLKSYIINGLNGNPLYLIPSGTTITVQNYEQYLIYGDLKISGGTITNYGQIIILDGSINVVSGNFNDFGQTLFVDTQGAILVTYSQLVSAIGTSSLITGKQYLIIDFQTIYDQPDFNSLGNPKLTVTTKTGSIEPLLVRAVSEYEISNVVSSPIYPNDQIKYDWSWDKTEIMFESTKGRITERIDDLGNRTDYDHRIVLFKRYETSPGSGIYIEIDDNGNNYQEFKTFQTETDNYSNTNFISDYAKLFYITSEPFLLSNNVFGEYSENNNLSGIFTNNTMSNYFKYNQSLTQIDKTDFTSATHVYGNYNCTLFENSDGDKALSFFGSGNVLTITNINT